VYSGTHRAEIARHRGAAGSTGLERRRDVVASVAVAVVGFAYRYLTFTEFSNDHYVNLSRSQQWLFGDWPVRDFVDPGMPLTYALSAAVQWVSGPSLHAELLLISATFAAAAVLTYVVAARVSGSTWLGVVAALVTLLVYPVSYSYPKLLPYAAALAAVWSYAQRPTPWRLALVGAITAAAFLLRQDHGVILGVALLVALTLQHRGSVTLRGAASFAVATSVFLLPFLIWVQTSEGVVNHFVDGVAFSRRAAEPAGVLPPALAIDDRQPLLVRPAEMLRGPVVNVRWVDGLSDAGRGERERRHHLTPRRHAGADTWQYELSDWSSDAVRALVTDAAVADTHGIDRYHFEVSAPVPGLGSRLLAHVVLPGPGLRLRPNGVFVLFWLVWLLPLGAACLLVTDARETVPARRLVVMAAAGTQVLMNVTMLRDPFDTRIRDVIVPAAVLLAFVAAVLWTSRRFERYRRAWRVVAAAIVVLMVLTTASIGAVDERLREGGISRGPAGISARISELGAELAPPQQRTGRLPAGYKALVDYLAACTPPGGRLFAMAFVPELFFYTGRGFAGGHVLFTPGYYLTERHASQTLARLAREDVPYVIADSETWPEMQKEHPRLAAHVAGRYHEVQRYTVALGRDLIVFADTGRRAERQFQSSLPCFAHETE
jgi:hypothetical protein